MFQSPRNCSKRVFLPESALSTRRLEARGLVLDDELRRFQLRGWQWSRTGIPWRPFMEQGERAIRAHLKAVRAAAKKPSCLNEAVSNRMDEVLARKDAETLVKPPEDLVRSSGEAIRPDFRLPHIVDTLQEPNMIGVVA